MKTSTMEILVGVLKNTKTMTSDLFHTLGHKKYTALISIGFLGLDYLVAHLEHKISLSELLDKTPIELWSDEEQAGSVEARINLIKLQNVGLVKDLGQTEDSKS